MKFLLRKSLFIFLATAFIAVSCTEPDTESADSTETTAEADGKTSNKVKVDARKNKVTSYVDNPVTPAGNYNDGETVIQAYALSDVEDWEAVKVVMNEFPIGSRDGLPSLQTVSHTYGENFQLS